MKHAVDTRRRFVKTIAGTAGAIALSRALPAIAQPKKSMPDVIVLLPGITGSVLRKDGKDVWAPSTQGVLNALFSLGASINALKLADDAVDRDDLDDGITADRLVPDVHLIPGFWKIDGYTRISGEIRRVFAVEPGKNFFEFPYDWRRDNRVAARHLARQSHAWLKAWREASGNAKAKLVLVAHSMGGLVSRYFLECMEGWRDTRALITFGTPYWGSLNALDFLCNGYRKSLGPVQVADLTQLLRSFTSVYQLLPVYPCYDAGDGKAVVVGETTGIPGVDAAKARAALAFHRDMDRWAASNAADEGYRSGAYKLQAVAGIFQPTLQYARFAAGRAEMLRGYPGKDYDGDGTVPRPSAKPRDYAKDPTFVVERHASLQNNSAALGQLAGVLTGSDFEPTWGPGALTLQLVIDDSYVVGEPIVIRARHEPADANVNLVAIVREASSGKTVSEFKLTAKSGGLHEGTVKALPAGTYRVMIRTGSDSVTDIFIVSS